ncbi:hypothetical protein MIND_00673700 [Mycena indigotica]|uniref:F-box domain-containing protein n=1 Tax=Mycena indigotica TaxID=2126181 RepID=A0A8H6W130_9AGAR|nr:uncharacterized protein MIND_00673700 [Mycena indigotica]KAF7301097.1 hypothetical protein MIND_00673700 [Mycena indigotica]
MHWPNSRIFYDILTQSASPGFEIHARALLEEAEHQLSLTNAQPDPLGHGHGQTHQQLVARIAALKYALSPVRRLPADILLEIFQRVVPLNNSPRFPYWFSSPNTHFDCVLRLGSVCSYWRQLIITAPRLWPTSMSLNGYKPSSYVDITRRLLQHSNPHPVDITIVGCALRLSASLQSHVTFTAISMAHRWRRISVECDIVPFLKAVPSSGPLYHLTEIDLKGLRWNENDKPSAFFLNAPLLTHVKLETSHPVKLLLPWSQLTKLELETVVGSSGFLTILEQCISMADLGLEDIICEEVGVSYASLQQPDMSLLDIVSLPHLRDLKVNMFDYGTFEPFFCHFRFPSLRKVVIQAMAGMGPDFDVSFLSFLQRCFALEHLEIFGCDLNSTLLGEILLCIPSLTYLNLHCCFYGVDDTFFERLTYRATDLNPPAPCLQRLRLESVGPGDHFSEDVILAMVRSRWWTKDTFQALPFPPHVARWQYIHISADDSGLKAPLSDEFKTIVAEFRAEGLTCEVFRARQ